MFKSLKNNGLRLVSLLSAIVLLSACNRGTGCPNNFKVDIDIAAILPSFVGLFF